MTKAEAIERLKALHGSDDNEQAHEEADGILLELLESNGFDGIREAFGKVPKWYA